jgi:hypothetical protein
MKEISRGINESRRKLPVELKDEITTRYSGKSEKRQTEIISA